MLYGTLSVRWVSRPRDSTSVCVADTAPSKESVLPTRMLTYWRRSKYEGVSIQSQQSSMDMRVTLPQNSVANTLSSTLNARNSSPLTLRKRSSRPSFNQTLTSVGTITWLVALPPLWSSRMTRITYYIQQMQVMPEFYIMRSVRTSEPPLLIINHRLQQKKCAQRLLEALSVQYLALHVSQVSLLFPGPLETRITNSLA